MFYQLVPGCRLCQAGWRWSQQLQALRTRWQRCKLTQSGSQPNVAPQSGTKYLAQKKKKIHRTPSKRSAETREFPAKSHICQEKKKTNSQLIRAAVSYLWSSIGGSSGGRCFRKYCCILTGSASSSRRSWIPRFHVALAENSFAPKCLWSSRIAAYDIWSREGLRTFSAFQPWWKSAHCGWLGIKT